MDIRMPDGSVLRGIPEGTSKEDVMAKYNSRPSAPIAKPPPHKIEAGDKATTTPQAKYQMQASDVIKSPMEQAEILGNGAPERLQDIRDMGAYDKFMINAGRTADKLVQGSKDVGDTLIGMFGPEDMGVDAIFRQMDRRNTEADKDRLFNQMEENKGVSGTLGSMVPYLVTEALAGPLASKTAGKVIDVAGKGVVSAGKEGGSAIADLIQKVAQSPQFKDVAKLAERDMVKYVRPIKKKAADVSARAPAPNRAREGMLADVLGGAGTGALEGLLHYNNSTVGGALSNTYGGVAGNMARPYLSRRPKYQSKTDKATIDWAESQGFRSTPGVRTDDPYLKRFDAGLRNSDKYGSRFTELDLANDKAINRTAFKAMGIPDDKIDDITRPQFKEYLDGIKLEYEDLVKDTKGVFNIKQWREFKDVAGTLSEQGNAEIQKDVAQIMGNLQRGNKPGGMDPLTGRQTPWSFDGKTFQAERSRIKSKINKAYEAKDMELVDAYNPLLKEMDKAIERGIERGGKVTPAQWKDLNERNAMSEILLEKGLRSDLTIDLDRLSKGFSKDQRRRLTEQGGRISDLHKLADLGDVMRKQVNPDAASVRAIDTPIKTTIRRKMMMPEGISNAVDDLAFGSYMKGFPKRTGYLGMNRDSFYQPATFGRAAHQETQFIPEAYESMKETYDEGKQEIKDWRKMYKELKKSMLK